MIYSIKQKIKSNVSEILIKISQFYFRLTSTTSLSVNLQSINVSFVVFIELVLFTIILMQDKTWDETP